jgi:hypothetical protein
MHINCWSQNVKGRDNLGDLGVDKKIILEWWTGCIWIRRGTSGRLL